MIINETVKEVKRVQVVSTSLQLTQRINGYDSENDKVILEPVGGTYSTCEVQLPSLEVDPSRVSSINLDLDNLPQELKDKQTEVLQWLIAAFEYSYANQPSGVIDPTIP